MSKLWKNSLQSKMDRRYLYEYHFTIPTPVCPHTKSVGLVIFLKNPKFFSHWRIK